MLTLNREKKYILLGYGDLDQKFVQNLIEINFLINSIFKIFDIQKHMVIILIEKTKYAITKNIFETIIISEVEI